MAVPTATQQRGHGKPFKAGKSGNPAGRKRGSRNKLGEAFLTDLYADFMDHGVEVIEKVRVTDPAAYLRVVAKILPSKLEVDVKSDIQMLTDEQLKQRIISLHNMSKITDQPVEGEFKDVTPAIETKGSPIAR